MTQQWKTAWVTGASSGIGEALAQALAAGGATVAISARSEDKLARLAAADPRLKAFPLDVTDSAAAAATVEAIEQTLGPIDLAILNAGIWQPVSAKNLTAGLAREMFEVNYLGAAYGSGAVLPRMIGRGHGHIAFTGSVGAYRGLSGSGAYSPAKAALLNLAECLYNDLKRHGVAVSVINPGYVDTPATRKNDFPMPFIMSAGEAAGRILAGLKKKKFDIAFPWQPVLLLKMLRILPYPLYFWAARNFLER